MITNHRSMGQTSGYWTGTEIEHTKFVGQSTIFFCRYTRLAKGLERALSHEHVFIPIIDPKFFEFAEDAGLGSVLGIVRFLLCAGKKVTIEAAVSESTNPDLVQIRKDYPYTFCLLLVVEVPEVEFGGFAIKAAPTVVFEDRPGERAVFTADFNKFIPTYWEEYKGDEDGR